MTELTKPGTPQELMLENHGVLGKRKKNPEKTVTSSRRARGSRMVSDFLSSGKSKTRRV